jgi:hypothetical protein
VSQSSEFCRHTLCVFSRVFILKSYISLSTQSGKFWIHPRRLRVFENRVLRIILGSKREEMAEGVRTVHSEELNNLYISSYIFT